MEITSDPLVWTSDDVANLRDFLKTRTGSRLLPKVVENAPVLFAGGDVNSIMIRTGELRGFQLAIQTLLSLTTTTPEAPVAENAYPSLVDDGAWAGSMGLAGEQIQPQN